MKTKIKIPIWSQNWDRPN